MRQGPEGAVLLSKGRLASGGNPSPHRLLVRGAGGSLRADGGVS